MADTPKSLGYRMPAEWEPHEGTWLSWPHNPRTWVGNFGPIPSVFVEIVRALCPHENVHIAVRDTSTEASVLRLLQDAGLDSAAIRCYLIPTNDAWARDHGPIFITRAPGLQLPLEFAPDDPPCATGGLPASADSLADKAAVPQPRPVPPAEDPQAAAESAAAQRAASHLAVVDWRFNSWGEKYFPWDDDDVVPDRVAEALNLPCFHPRMVLEGGSIDVNGQGTLLTTESVLLNPNRNPQLNRKQIEARLDEYLAARQVVWLGGGIDGDDTDGHVDDIARFVNSTTVLRRGRGLHAQQTRRGQAERRRGWRGAEAEADGTEFRCEALERRIRHALADRPGAEREEAVVELACRRDLRWHHLHRDD